MEMADVKFAVRVLEDELAILQAYASTNPLLKVQHEHLSHYIAFIKSYVPALEEQV